MWKKAFAFMTLVWSFSLCAYVPLQGELSQQKEQDERPFLIKGVHLSCKAKDLVNSLWHIFKYHKTEKVLVNVMTKDLRYINSNREQLDRHGYIQRVLAASPVVSYTISHLHLTRSKDTVTACCTLSVETEATPGQSSISAQLYVFEKKDGEWKLKATADYGNL